MESVKISPKKCKIAMALAGHHNGLLAGVSLSLSSRAPRFPFPSLSNPFHAG